MSPVCGPFSMRGIGDHMDLSGPKRKGCHPFLEEIPMPYCCPHTLSHWGYSSLVPSGLEPLLAGENPFSQAHVNL